MRIDQDRCVERLIEMFVKKSGWDSEFLRYSWLAVLDVPSLEGKIVQLQAILPAEVFQEVVAAGNRLHREHPDTEAIPTWGRMLEPSPSGSWPPDEAVPKEYWEALAGIA